MYILSEGLSSLKLPTQLLIEIGGGRRILDVRPHRVLLLVDAIVDGQVLARLDPHGDVATLAQVLGQTPIDHMSAAQDHPHLLRSILVQPGILALDRHQLGSQRTPAAVAAADGLQSRQLDQRLTAATQLLGQRTAALGAGCGLDWCRHHGSDGAQAQIAEIQAPQGAEAAVQGAQSQAADQVGQPPNQGANDGQVLPEAGEPAVLRLLGLGIRVGGHRGDHGDRLQGLQLLQGGQGLQGLQGWIDAVKEDRVVAMGSANARLASILER